MIIKKKIRCVLWSVQLTIYCKFDLKRIPAQQGKARFASGEIFGMYTIKF